MWYVLTNDIYHSLPVSCPDWHFFHMYDLHVSGQKISSLGLLLDLRSPRGCHKVKIQASASGFLGRVVALLKFDPGYEQRSCELLRDTNPITSHQMYVTQLNIWYILNLVATFSYATRLHILLLLVRFHHDTWVIKPFQCHLNCRPCHVGQNYFAGCYDHCGKCACWRLRPHCRWCS